MVLQRWDPMFELRRMHGAIVRRWPEYRFAVDSAHSRGWAIPVDVVEEGDDLLVRASLPGINPEQIDVSIEDHTLTIKADTKVEEELKEGDYLMRERRTGSFRRSLRLPETVDSDNAKTTYENGILTVSLPKGESKKVKHLKVATGKALKSESK